MGISCNGLGDVELRFPDFDGVWPLSPPFNMAEILGIVVPEALVCGGGEAVAPVWA